MLNDRRWELLLCSSCGSKGVHIGCGRLDWSTMEWDCEDCNLKSRTVISPKLMIVPSINTVNITSRPLKRPHSPDNVQNSSSSSRSSRSNNNTSNTSNTSNTINTTSTSNKSNSGCSSSDSDSDVDVESITDTESSLSSQLSQSIASF